MRHERQAPAAGAMADAVDSAEASDGQLSVPQLLQACQDCCTTFNPAQLSLDAHADAFLAERDITVQSDCSFIKQVLYGTVRFHALLKTFVEAFYRKNRFELRIAVSTADH